MTNGEWNRIGTAAVVILACIILVAAVLYFGPSTPPPKYAPKVFVITASQPLPVTADTPGEFRNWYAMYWNGTAPITVPGALHPVYCNRSGICGTVTGEGKTNAAASLSAVLADPRFDFSRTIFLSDTLGGIRPDRGTLGSVVIATDIVDFDLWYKWAASDDPCSAVLWQPSPLLNVTTRYRLNPRLVAAASNLTAGIPLASNPEADAFKARYPDPAARAAPLVMTGPFITSDAFWHGTGMAGEAEQISAAQNASYTVTVMEDSAFAEVLLRRGYDQRFIAIRSISNFDRQYPGQDIRSSLAVMNTGGSGGWRIGLDNGFTVGNAIAQSILADPGPWERAAAGV